MDDALAALQRPFRPPPPAPSLPLGQQNRGRRSTWIEVYGSVKGVAPYKTPSKNAKLFRRLSARPFRSCQLLLGDGSDGLLGGIVKIRGGYDGQAALLEKPLSTLHVGSFEANYERDAQSNRAGSVDDALSDHVALHDTTKDVD